MGIDKNNLRFLIGDWVAVGAVARRCGYQKIIEPEAPTGNEALVRNIVRYLANNYPEGHVGQIVGIKRSYNMSLPLGYQEYVTDHYSVNSDQYGIIGEAVVTERLLLWDVRFSMTTRPVPVFDDDIMRTEIHPDTLPWCTPKALFNKYPGETKPESVPEELPF